MNKQSERYEIPKKRRTSMEEVSQPATKHRDMSVHSIIHERDNTHSTCSDGGVRFKVTSRSSQPPHSVKLTKVRGILGVCERVDLTRLRARSVKEWGMSRSEDDRHDWGNFMKWLCIFNRLTENDGEHNYSINKRDSRARLQLYSAVLIEFQAS